MKKQKGETTNKTKKKIVTVEEKVEAPNYGALNDQIKELYLLAGRNGNLNRWSGSQQRVMPIGTAQAKAEEAVQFMRDTLENAGFDPSEITVSATQDEKRLPDPRGAARGMNHYRVPREVINPDTNEVVKNLRVKRVTGIRLNDKLVSDKQWLEHMAQQPEQPVTWSVNAPTYTLVPEHLTEEHVQLLTTKLAAAIAQEKAQPRQWATDANVLAKTGAVKGK